MWSDYMIVTEYNIEMEKVLWIDAGSKEVLVSIAHRHTMLHCSVRICDTFYQYAYLISQLC